LPFLLKIIAAAQPLSLQAHPSPEQAEAGCEREQATSVPRDAPHRTYRDGWPTPELLWALAEPEALCGFREPRETYRLFEKLAVTEALELVASDRRWPHGHVGHGDGTVEMIRLVKVAKDVAVKARTSAIISLKPTRLHEATTRLENWPYHYRTDP
jgi:Phosphomannose isomerase type I, catalytic domain